MGKGTLQEYFWDFISDYTGRQEFIAPQANKALDLFEEMSDLFRRYLPDEQLSAFDNLMKLVGTINCDQYHEGLVKGIKFSTEVKNMLEHPEQVYLVGSLRASPADISVLEEYFEDNLDTIKRAKTAPKWPPRQN